jgi:hypothetical protein
MENNSNIDKNFQWIKGDDFGKIVTVSSEDNNYMYFAQGGRISLELVKEYLLATDEIALDPALLEVGTQTITTAGENPFDFKSPGVTNVEVPTIKNIDFSEKFNKALSLSGTEQDITLSATIKLPDTMSYQFLANFFSEDDVNAEIEKIVITAIKEELSNYIKTKYSNETSN